MLVRALSGVVDPARQLLHGVPSEPRQLLVGPARWTHPLLVRCRDQTVWQCAVDVTREERHLQGASVPTPLLLGHRAFAAAKGASAAALTMYGDTLLLTAGAPQNKAGEARPARATRSAAAFCSHVRQRRKGCWRAACA
jgi:hypothetical protein